MLTINKMHLGICKKICTYVLTLYCCNEFDNIFDNKDVHFFLEVSKVVTRTM